VCCCSLVPAAEPHRAPLRRANPYSPLYRAHFCRLLRVHAEEAQESAVRASQNDGTC